MIRVFDVEANGLYREATHIWCVSSKELHVSDSMSTEVSSTIGDIKGIVDYIEELFTADKLIGHNIINFDLPLIRKLTGLVYNGDVYDTLVVSKLLNPDREVPWKLRGKKVGPHSVEAWACRLGGEEKVQNERWDIWDDNIAKRCESDVRLQERIYDAVYMESQR